jgi:type 1 glutamine amidotransferase
VRKFVAAGKPVIGIRTASHAFCLRNERPADGLADWPEFDAQVFGGNYTNHYANDQHPTIAPLDSAASALGLPRAPFTSSGSLYKVSPPGPGVHFLLMGSIPGQEPEPVAWTNVRKEGGRSFYTSLGHKGDFEEDAFRLLLVNGINWCCDQPLATLEEIQKQRRQYQSGHGKQR